jgi:DNA topoisomerase I
MAKSLVIVESPAKAKTINKYLGRNFVVKASMGHVKDLPKSKLGVDLEHGFEPDFITIRGKSKVLKELKDAAKKVDNIYLAPDPDREGEAIAAHLAELLAQDSHEVYRVTFNEITKSAVQEAFKHPGQVDRNKVEAQQARRILDRLVGYLVSPFLWKVITYGTSAGRVQTVALRMIGEREEEIAAFRSEEYWSIDVDLIGKAKAPFTAGLREIDGVKAEIGNGEMAQSLRERLERSSYRVLDVEKKTRRRKPTAPFTTSTLQQDASRRLGFSAKKTMMVAQQLYEGVEIEGEGLVGLITYMRTDSVRVSQEAQTQAQEYVRSAHGGDYLPETPNVYKSKGRAQEAHEAVRPTQITLDPERVKASLTKDQARLYDLVWKRFLASQMSPAVMDQTSVDIEAADPNAKGKSCLLRATGSVLVFPGHLAVYGGDNKKVASDAKNGEKNGEGNGESIEDRLLPVLAKDEPLTLTGERVRPEQHFTQPPPRYSEASLVKALEEEGIGRPSTYADDHLHARCTQIRRAQCGALPADRARQDRAQSLGPGFAGDLRDEVHRAHGRRARSHRVGRGQVGERGRRFLRPVPLCIGRARCESGRDQERVGGDHREELRQVRPADDPEVGSQRQIPGVLRLPRLPQHRTRGRRHRDERDLSGVLRQARDQGRTLRSLSGVLVVSRVQVHEVDRLGREVSQRRLPRRDRSTARQEIGTHILRLQQLSELRLRHLGPSRRHALRELQQRVHDRESALCRGGPQMPGLRGGKRRSLILGAFLLK